MDLAYNLMTEGGHFLQFDEFSFDGGFGNLMDMEPYAHGNGMNMIVEGCGDAYNTDSGFGFVLWKKVPPGYDRIADLDRMRATGESMEILRWRPEIPNKKQESAEEDD